MFNLFGLTSTDNSVQYGHCMQLSTLTYMYTVTHDQVSVKCRHKYVVPLLYRPDTDGIFDQQIAYEEANLVKSVHNSNTCLCYNFNNSIEMHIQYHNTRTRHLVWISIYDTCREECSTTYITLNQYLQQQIVKCIRNYQVNL